MQLLFTHEDYLTQFSRLLQQPLVACEYWEFGFENEQIVSVARAEKTAFENSLHFFVNALRFIDASAFSYSLGETTNPDSQTFAVYKITPLVSMSREMFYDFLEHYTPKQQYPRFFTPASTDIYDNFLGALDVEFDYDRCVIAEFEGFYIVLSWSTGA